MMSQYLLIIHLRYSIIKQKDMGQKYEITINRAQKTTLPQSKV